MQCKAENGPEYRNRLERELGEIHPIIRACLLDMDWYCQTNFDKNIVITSLIRTPEENERVGGNPLSAHLDARAGDVRNRTFSALERKQLVEYVQDGWGDIIFILDESDHFHVNVNRGFA